MFQWERSYAPSLFVVFLRIESVFSPSTEVPTMINCPGNQSIQSLDCRHDITITYNPSKGSEQVVTMPGDVILLEFTTTFVCWRCNHCVTPSSTYQDITHWWPFTRAWDNNQATQRLHIAAVFRYNVIGVIGESSSIGPATVWALRSERHHPPSQCHRNATNTDSVMLSG